MPRRDRESNGQIHAPTNRKRCEIPRGGQGRCEPFHEQEDAEQNHNIHGEGCFGDPHYVSKSQGWRYKYNGDDEIAGFILEIVRFPKTRMSIVNDRGH
jgi:hypothetical protein